MLGLACRVGIDGPDGLCLTLDRKLPLAGLALFLWTFSASGSETKLFDELAVAKTEFYEGNDVVHRIALQKPGRKISTSNGRPYETNFVAISLEGVPLVMLDSVTRINFRRSD
ncbi:MAG: hypothetical protein GVY36_05510 [Verrucomicrobia bacterium]|nr:hypothetical protein [Verrucomicrobiota bacterium]